MKKSLLILSGATEFAAGACYLLLAFGLGCLARVLRSLCGLCQVGGQQMARKATKATIPVPLGVFPPDLD
jgi:hypothetical protein